ncbi:hypothetical protein SAMN05518848_12017 [Paenibacillus sp. PDC88]|nr:hypothetical protein SAMN05518848_12017 [Paenibacillus sp. PDC88]
MATVFTIAILSFVAWLHAVILRISTSKEEYNKYVFISAILMYLSCNYIQAQTFQHKTIFNLAFIAYSLVSIPIHIWLLSAWTKSKRKPTH